MPERRSVVRRSLQAVEPAAGARAAAVQEAEDAVAGQDQGRQERQDHEPGASSRRLTEAPAAEHAEPTLRLRGVGRRFGGLHAVREVDLEVAAGERRAILGPNGAGKTTLFNVICGDFPATSGTRRAVRQGRDPRPCARASEDGPGAHLPAVAALRRALTVEDNIYLSVLGVHGGHMRPVVLRKDAEYREQARAAAERAAIDHKLSELCRLALARRASPGRARGRARRRAADADARRAVLGALARRASAPDRPPACARPRDHADRDRARHGRRAARRRAGDDDARRPRDRRGDARRDPRERARPRPLPRAGPPQ